MYEFTYRNSAMGLGMTGMFMTALSAQWKERKVCFRTMSLEKGVLGRMKLESKWVERNTWLNDPIRPINCAQDQKYRKIWGLKSCRFV
jgi:hypothetical protein